MEVISLKKQLTNICFAFNFKQTYKNGLIFHKFEIPGVCERTITTIVNE